MLTHRLAKNPDRIWLAPACNVDERTWCEHDPGCCDECGEPSVEYRLVEKPRPRLRRMSDMTTTGNDLNDIGRAADEIERLYAKLKGIEIALARDGDIDAAMHLILEPRS